eukprot:sb/3464949/
MACHLGKRRMVDLVKRAAGLGRRAVVSGTVVQDENWTPRKVAEELRKERSVYKKGEICDQVTIYLRGGSGGGGLARKNAIGGNGGKVLLEALPSLRNLNHIHQHPTRKFVAGAGENAGDGWIRGREGEDCVIEVPAGTVAMDVQTGDMICDVDVENKLFLVQKRRVSMSNGHCPYCGYHCLTPPGSLTNNYMGKRGKERYVKLVMKSMADVGLVGYPNAGKSSLLSMVSKSAPKIGSYPFTTLKPTVGTVRTTDHSREVTIADIPGLIEGASENRGLGHVFLQHIERTKILLFVLDVQGFQLNYREPHRTPFQTFGYLARELELYMAGLTKRPIVIAVNKMDTEGSDEEFNNFTAQYREQLRKLVRVSAIVPVSCFTGQGLDQLTEGWTQMKISGDVQWPKATVRGLPPATRVPGGGPGGEAPGKI